MPFYKGKIWCGNGPCVGANNPQLARDYNLVPQYQWSVNYFALNFRNPAVAPIFNQLYIRQAMQSLVNQAQWTDLVGGYAQPGYGPVPVFPPTKFASPQVKQSLTEPGQPHAREDSAQLARLEGGPERHHDLCEAGNGRWRVRGRLSQRAPS